MKKITLKAARVNAGLTQEEAAQAINVTGRTLISWENGVTYPTVDKLLRLCNLYDVQVGDIFIPLQFS